jgi:regulator of sirC expression with transglutaminase-like and TPR domain
MMSENEILALITLLDDEDREVSQQIENQLYKLGVLAIPYLEKESTKEGEGLKKLRAENILRNLRLQDIKAKLDSWKTYENNDLLKGICLVNSYQNPSISYEKLYVEIEQMFYDVWVDFKFDLHPLDEVRILNSAFFDKFKFRSNSQQFHVITNSMLDTVIDTKKGNPISLCIIYLLIAQKLRLPIKGVNLPNIFILTYKSPQIQFYVNVFNKGAVLSRVEIEHYISELKMPHLPEYYEPCTNLDIVRRVLRNMHMAYEKNGEEDRMKDIHDLIEILK